MIQITPVGNFPNSPESQRKGILVDPVTAITNGPVIAVTDAALLAARVDGTLLVVRAGGTQREHVERAKSLLEKTGARLVGAMLTNASLDSSMSSYYR